MTLNSPRLLPVTIQAEKERYLTRAGFRYRS
jgi:hypothetical protein